ncbi:hypothetical protein [Pirellula sp. SH-Sr6A]|uniref:hypothetical protein n=1 Tax=Pirellula sp. SH-Sr6A TaxID=1632865 RepID=UPI001F0B2013|nr:hypothetical protein [Pirellula sp. SH-Sr6A]
MSNNCPHPHPHSHSHPRARLVSFRFGLAVLVLALGLGRNSNAQFVSGDLEKEPFRYSDTEANNRVSKLIAAMEKGDVALEQDGERGYLRSLLKHLEIPESSQVLVFSKTSLQVQHISPRNPRAIYFNDDTYVGSVPGSSLVEISTNDPKLGATFYSFRMGFRLPRIRQETYQCLGCHATSMTKGVPGHAVRSGYPNYDGDYDVKREAFVTDETSEFSRRWGGWYVTGLHGSMQHMGNGYLQGGMLDTTRFANLSSLDKLFDVSKYLTPHSDIHALMVLEHQTQTHNTITLADFRVRTLEHEDANQDPAERSVQLGMIAKEVVDRLLFCKEFALTSNVSGTSGFAQDFLKRGPKDSKGRSLREFDMLSRMFKYPLSYLIYSDAFDAMSPSLRDAIGGQLNAILQGDNQDEEYRHLTPELRQQIREIVQETKPDLLR